MNFGRVIIGLFLIVIAVTMIGTAMGYESIGFQFFQFAWPALLTLWGLTMLVEKRFNFVKLTATLIGLLYLAKAIFQFPLNGSVVGAVIILVIGISILFRRGGGPKGQYTSQERIHDAAIFGGKNTIINDKFKFAETTALFGGAQLNLLGAKIDGEATVEATAIFGGIEIIVPETFKLIIHGTPVFGGVDNKTRNVNLPDDAPQVVINATAIFGGIEIKN